MRVDVLVVGAGPVGLTMAAELARYGVSVRIVDKAPERTDKSKALVIWSRTLELMDRMGCSQEFISAGYQARSVDIVAAGKPIAHVTFEKVETPHPYALMLPQSETERLMAEHLKRLEVSVERAVELTHFLDLGDYVESTLQRADGSQETVVSSWLIGCDGAHSVVRHKLGLEFQGSTLLSDWILADVHLEGERCPNGVEIHWHADGVLAIFPITPGRFRVIADTGLADGALGPDPTLDEVQAAIDQRGLGGIRVSAPVWLARFRINERKVQDYKRGRVFVAGDAAHIHSPAGGQGMNTGMQDAFNLAWKLALVCRGEGAEGPLLASYSAERSAIGDEVLKATGIATTMALVRGDLKQSIRNHAAAMIFGFSAVRKQMANTMTEVSLGYPHSPLNGNGSHAGMRASIRQGESPVGSGREPRFVLFGKSSTDTEHLVDEFPALVESVIRPPLHEAQLCLVRPDGYLAASSHSVRDIREFLMMIS